MPSCSINRDTKIMEALIMSMSIKVGDKIPNVSLKQATSNGPIDLNTSDFFKDKTTILFAIPGAFTPICSSKHLPSFVAHKQQLVDKGVDQIACISVNDPFVMQAWAESQHTRNEIAMIADGNGDLTRALGFGMDLTALGLGYRSQRYAMIIKDGKVTRLEVEPASTCNLTSAEHFLSIL
jgi:peroxiredoxin